MRYPALILSLAFSYTSLAATHSGEAGLTNEIQRLERQYGGHLGVMAKNLNTGATVAYNADERFPTASVIKFPVMAAFFDMVERKEIDPEARVVLTGEDKKPGSGVLQYLGNGATISLLDAVRLMIVLSDNTATNLVLDRLAPTHAARLARVNDFLVRKGIKNTRILNRLYSPSTKQLTPEAIRYGIGVSTPEDMVRLLEGLHARTLLKPESCNAMQEILKQQFYRDMIPRLLPENGAKFLEIGNKTGFVNETKVDVALILSDRASIAMAIFVDKHPDHRETLENPALMLAAQVSRAIWNHFTGDKGYELGPPPAGDVDWNSFPGGRWAIYRSASAPFPHPSREAGYRHPDGSFFPYHPHYDDNSLIVVVPDGLAENQDGTNVIVHFHGHMNDNLDVLERYGMPQALVARKINALLVLAQGPYRARDSAGGKMEDEGGFAALVKDVIATMQKEGVLKSDRLNKVIVSAHSGGYRPAAFALARGGISDKISDVFLFDAFYGEQDSFRAWLDKFNGRIFAAYTDHLAVEHTSFEQGMSPEERRRLVFTHTRVEHDEVVQAFFGKWLSQLRGDWKQH